MWTTRYPLNPPLPPRATYLPESDPRGGGASGVSSSYHPFVFLASSYSTTAGNVRVAPPDETDLEPSNSATAAGVSNAEFRKLCIAVSEVVPMHVPSAPAPAPPGPGPAPSPPGAKGLGLAACNANDARQLWTFSGEDRGEAGVLKAQSNATLCLDLAGHAAGSVMPEL